MKSVLAIAPLALAFTACSPDSEVPVGDDGAIIEPSEDKTARADVDAVSMQVDGVPERFLGVWDYVEGSCDPMSDLRMDLRADRIEFYESFGEITDVERVSDNEIVVSLAMEGEGETWTQSTRFTLEDGGERLVPTSADGEDQWDPMPLKRCPAG